MLKKTVFFVVLFSITILGSFDPAKEFNKIQRNVSKYPITIEKLKSQIEPYNEILSQDWNSDDVWENNHLSTSVYDETNHVLTTVEYKPDSVLTWKCTQKTISNYNLVQGFLLPSTATSYTFADTGWVKMASVDYTFDNDYCMIQSRMFLFLGGTMMLYGQVDFTYNSVKNELLEITQILNFQTFALENSSKREYNYNPNDPNDLTSIVEYDFENGAWVNSEKTTYTRNAKYQILTELNELYVSADSLQKRFYEVSEYVADTLLISLDVTSWEEESGIYCDRTKHLYTYDVNNNCINTLSQEYIEETNGWSDFYRITYTFDNANRLTHELGESYSISAWENVYQKFTYYTPTTDVEDELINVNNYSLSNNYPNPFNPSTTIKFNIPTEGFVTLKVYDMLGREVATLVNENKQIGEYSYNFNASNLASGMYIYQLKVNNFVSSKKMLLVK